MKKFLERTSVRCFDGNALPNEDLKKITNVINNSPTSTNSQQFSAIIVKDQELKNWISEKNWGQKHIAESAAFIIFVADRFRMEEIGKRNNLKLDEDMLMHEFVRSLTDAVIATTYAQDALIQMGYGTTIVGGILSFAEELKQKFDLPKYTYPVLGLSLGKTTKTNKVKPKMQKVFINKYDKNLSIKNLDDYNESSKEVFNKRNQVSYLEQSIGYINPNTTFAKFSKKAGILLKKELEKQNK